MGNRAEVDVHEGETPGVYLYTHWDGYTLPETVRNALASDAGRNRWNDSPYLTRILFDALTRGTTGQESGFGISAQRSDGSLVKVDVANQTVTVGEREPVSFTEFIGGRNVGW